MTDVVYVCHHHLSFAIKARKITVPLFSDENPIASGRLCFVCGGNATFTIEDVV